MTVRVDNLPNGFDKEDVTSLFGRYGNIGDIYFPAKRFGKFPGYVFVRYYNRRDAEDAIDELNGRYYSGSDLSIKIDEGRPM